MSGKTLNRNENYEEHLGVDAKYRYLQNGVKFDAAGNEIKTVKRRTRPDSSAVPPPSTEVG